MRKRLLLIFFYLCAATGLAMGQERTVTGTVVSTEDGSTLPGVNVLIKGTSTGTITDIDGNYRITVPGNDAVLQFSYVGFSTKEVTVGAQSTVDIDLGPDYTEISEVVVVGYGTKRKEELTGSIEVVGAEKLEQLPSSSFQSALQGSVAGMQVTTTDGAPGAGISVRVRGVGSINASNDPLYVIDGIPVSSGSISQTDFGNGGRSSNVLASLNPNDIQNITVLKDASSTAIYGSRGANGVVLITTKSGAAGKAKIDLKTQVGFSDFAYNNLLEPVNADQYTELFHEGNINRGYTLEESQEEFNTNFPDLANTNWLDEMTQTGVSQQYDLSATGGSDKVTYFLSGGYYNQEGVTKENKFERFSGRANVKANLSEKLIVSNNINLSQFTQRGITDGTAWEAPYYLASLLPPTIPVKDDQGRYYGDHTNIMGGNNPVGQLYDNTRELKQTRIIDNITATYDIIEDLTFSSKWSFDILNINEFIFENGRYGDGRNIGGFGNTATTSEINWIGTQTLQYSKTFNEDHNFDILIGYESQKVTRDIVETEAQNYPHPDLQVLANASTPTAAYSNKTDYSFLSYFSRINYDFAGKYYGSVSLRRDASSRFSPENRWSTFWSVGGGYTISEEAFMDNVSWVNNLKLRASYGVTGNANIGNFSWAGLYEFSNINYQDGPGGVPSQVANSALTWESQENFNIGIDFLLLNSRLSGNIEYFIRQSTDLILDRPLSYTTGFQSVTQNVGDMRNNGVEIALNANLVQTPNFTLDLGGNITFLNNEITHLPEPFVDPDFDEFRREEGRDFQEFYLFGWAGVDPDNGDALFYTDGTKQETTNDINEASRFYDGKSASPDYYGGINLNAAYKGLSLNFFFNYQFGNYVYDGPGWVIHSDGRYFPRSTSVYAYENRWQQPGDEALFPRYVAGNTSGSNTQNSSRYLYKGDFIRLKTINLAYDFPATITSKLNVRSLRVYTNLNNYFTWVADDDLYFDPEQSTNGIYNTITPLSKSINLGINIGF
ncbi:SusC/RagA family TonB-linked outer membrane protein [Chondrinema litorale]|uniref:SusC/RagA family TonB-linked outer membrane protein n=1 Tax=Chondrinema litorale TaxID=2994555 RepID=UPI0025435E03|nr:TonB-dependent receptor [Chondrinema litorale]UZR94603.1 TonB-dependent receptor [Chondrinema litorale]